MSSTVYSVQPPLPSPSTGDSAYATVQDNDEYSSVQDDGPVSHDDVTTVMENQCGYHTDV